MGSNQRHRKRVTSLALAMLLICENLGANFGHTVGLRARKSTVVTLDSRFRRHQKF